MHYSGRNARLVAKEGRKIGPMAGVHTNANPTLDRKAKIASATPAEREQARQDYIVYARLNREIDSTPVGFEAYLAEWLDVRRSKRLDAGAEPDNYDARDYRALYGG